MKEKLNTWEVYGYTVVAFGDKAAALALELAKELVASLANPLDPHAARQLTRNSMVEDVGGGGSEEDMRRMRARVYRDHLSPSGML